MATISGWRRLHSETFLLGGEKAREFAIIHNSLPASPTERPIEPDRIKRLRAVLLEGRAISFAWSTVVFQGKTYRMNGQHSSQVLAKLDSPLPEAMVFHVDRYEAETKEGMGDLFCQFDARWSSRSRGDVAGAYQGLVEGVAGCARDKAKLAIEGVLWFRRWREKVPVETDDKAYKLFFEESLHPFIKFVDEVLSIKTPEMKNPGVMAALYETFSLRNEEAARAFWKHVALDDQTDDTRPSSVLSKELVAIKEKARGESTPRAEIYGKCVKAWNAFRAGEVITSLKVNIKKELPSAVA